MAVLDREQENPVAGIDLDPYRGKWVAIRDGEVVATDTDAVALLQNPDVRSDDYLTPVPSDDESLFLL
jgi:hypothetical protein